MHTLTFTNEDGCRETLDVRGPRCVAEWHAAKLRRQRVTRVVMITSNAPADLPAVAGKVRRDVGLRR